MRQPMYGLFGRMWHHLCTYDIIEDVICIYCRKGLVIAGNRKTCRKWTPLLYRTTYLRQHTIFSYIEALFRATVLCTNFVITSCVWTTKNVLVASSVGEFSPPLTVTLTHTLSCNSLMLLTETHTDENFCLYFFHHLSPVTHERPEITVIGAIIQMRIAWDNTDRL